MKFTPEHASHYLFEVVRESDIVEDCYRRFSRAAETWLEAHYGSEQRGTTVSWEGTEAEREMMASIEGILSAYARISLMFFPTGGAGFARERGEALRKLVKIDNSHPLGDRKLRNHWMHFDERLDEALQKSGEVPLGYLLQLPHLVSTTTVTNTLRLVDPGNETVYILGTAFPLERLVSAVEHVNQQAVLALFDDDHEKVEASRSL